MVQNWSLVGLWVIWWSLQGHLVVVQDWSLVGRCSKLIQYFGNHFGITRSWGRRIPSRSLLQRIEHSKSVKLFFSGVELIFNRSLPRIATIRFPGPDGQFWPCSELILSRSRGKVVRVFGPNPHSYDKSPLQRCLLFRLFTLPTMEYLEIMRAPTRSRHPWSLASK